MQFRGLKELKKALDERGHSMLPTEDFLLCERCGKWAKLPVPNDHAYGDAVGANCNK